MRNQDILLEAANALAWLAAIAEEISASRMHIVPAMDPDNNGYEIHLGSNYERWNFLDGWDTTIATLPHDYEGHLASYFSIFEPEAVHFLEEVFRYHANHAPDFEPVLKLAKRIIGIED